MERDVYNNMIIDTASMFDFAMTLTDLARGWKIPSYKIK